MSNYLNLDESHQWEAAQMEEGITTTLTQLSGVVIEFYLSIFTFLDVPPRQKLFYLV